MSVIVCWVQALCSDRFTISVIPPADATEVIDISELIAKSQPSCGRCRSNAAARLNPTNLIVTVTADAKHSTAPDSHRLIRSARFIQVDRSSNLDQKHTHSANKTNAAEYVRAHSSPSLLSLSLLTSCGVSLSRLSCV